jgi:glutathione peroxidase
MKKQKFMPTFMLSLLITLLPAYGFSKSLAEYPQIKDYKGKTVLVVNIATRCGYTPQLESLEKLYSKYKDKNFVVVGIPSNDFLSQTPENDTEIAKFCKLNYGVTFPLAPKIIVKGKEKDPFIRALLDQTPDKSEIGWNFEKFLISKEGKLVGRFKSSVKPEDKELQSKIESILN